MGGSLPERPDDPPSHLIESRQALLHRPNVPFADPVVPAIRTPCPLLVLGVHFMLSRLNHGDVVSRRLMRGFS